MYIISVFATMFFSVTNTYAQCRNWRVTDPIDFLQSNDIGVTLALRQSGNDLSGNARQTFVPDKGPGILGDLGMIGSDPKSINGQVDGIMSGPLLSLKIFWDNATVGLYKLEIDDHGQISGTTYDFLKPSSQAAITGYTRVACDDAPAAVQSGPVHRLGKKPSSTVKPAPSTAVGRLKMSGGSGIIRIVSAVSCKPGFVWREAKSGDTVCVPPAARDKAKQENALAGSRMARGFNTCVKAFVRREAYVGDTVCVTPERRVEVREENRLAPTRVVDN
jgi:hypothetical protein